MSKKQGNFIEEYLDKIILAVIGIVCIWLLVTRVFGSGNVVVINDEKLGPGEVDRYILDKMAANLDDRIRRGVDKTKRYEPKLDEYEKIMASSVGQIDDGRYCLLPAYGKEIFIDNREYRIPRIGPVTDVVAYHVRRVARTEAGQRGTDWQRVPSQLEDVDLVTVEGKFNAAALCERFRESFLSSGASAGPTGRQSRYSTPVFAAVRLERRLLDADGEWSQLQAVPRAKIRSAATIPDMPETADKLPADLDVEILMLQFNKFDTQLELLQPDVYNFADSGSKGVWLPPSAAKDRDEEQEKQARQKKGLERERSRTDKERQRSVAPQKSSFSTQRGMPGMPGMTGPGMPGGMRPFGPGTGRQTERVTPGRQPSEDFGEIGFTEATDINSLEELVFWAHDNTANLDNTYQYRIQIGVFNPIAGKDLFSAQDAKFKNDLILWSQFSEATEAVKIPARCYFFPTKVRPLGRGVTIKVCRYLLGNWYSKDFNTRAGEPIGGVIKTAVFERNKDDTMPEQIDYSTGAVLIAVVTKSDWDDVGGLRRREYSEILYARQDNRIKHLAFKKAYWPSDLRQIYKEIDETMKDDEKPRRKPRRPSQDRTRQQQQRRPDRKPGTGSFMPVF